MIKVFGVPFESSVSLRKALGLYGSKWCEKADITELLRCAFPMFTRADHVRNMEGFKMMEYLWQKFRLKRRFTLITETNLE